MHELQLLWKLTWTVDLVEVNMDGRLNLANERWYTKTMHPSSLTKYK